MTDRPSSVVLIRTMHPVLEGVVRLAASTVSSVHAIRSVAPTDLATAVVASRCAIVVADLQAATALQELEEIAAAGTDPRIVLLVDADWSGSVLSAIRLGVSAFVRVPEAV